MKEESGSTHRPEGRFMKSLIVYSSQTGNSRKLAEAAADIIAGEKTICAVDNAPDPGSFNLVLVTFWLKGGQPDPKAAAFLGMVNNQRVLLAATHGAAADSDHAITAMKHAVDLAGKATVVGTFSCQGEVRPTFLKKALLNKPQPPWLKDAPAAAGHPDAADLRRFQRLIQGILPEFAV
jgi:flavodoxin I